MDTQPTKTKIILLHFQEITLETLTIVLSLLTIRE